MKAERKYFQVYDGQTLVEAINGILGEIEDIVDLQKSMKFFVDVIEAYRLWLACEYRFDDELRLHTGFISRKKIWIVKITKKKEESIK